MTIRVRNRYDATRVHRSAHPALRDREAEPPRVAPPRGAPQRVPRPLELLQERAHRRDAAGHKVAAVGPFAADLEVAQHVAHLVQEDGVALRKARPHRDARVLHLQAAVAAREGASPERVDGVHVCDREAERARLDAPRERELDRPRAPRAVFVEVQRRVQDAVLQGVAEAAACDDREAVPKGAEDDAPQRARNEEEDGQAQREEPYGLRSVEVEDGAEVRGDGVHDIVDTPRAQSHFFWFGTRYAGVVGAQMVSPVYLASLAGTLVLWRGHARAPARYDDVRHETATHLVRSLGPIVWPSALLTLVEPRDRSCRALLVPLLWPLAVYLVDTRLLRHAPAAQPEQIPALRFDPATVTALSFGLSGIAGARADTRYVHLFLVAVLTCALVVMPAHNLAPSRERAVVEAVQRTAMVWCIGLMTAAVVLTRSCASPNAPTTRPPP